MLDAALHCSSDRQHTLCKHWNVDIVIFNVILSITGMDGGCSVDCGEKLFVTQIGKTDLDVFGFVILDVDVRLYVLWQGFGS